MSLHLLAETHRRNLHDLTVLAERDLRILFDRYTDADKARDALLATLPHLAAIYGAAAATLAADWYDDLRSQAGVRGRFTPLPAEPVGTHRTDVLARWGVGPLYSATPDPVKALALVAGGLQKIIGDCSRQTITASSIDDPAAQAWTRVTFDCCEYCQGLADDETFTTESSADFESHTNCRCIAAPAF